MLERRCVLNVQASAPKNLKSHEMVHARHHGLSVTGTVPESGRAVIRSSSHLLGNGEATLGRIALLEEETVSIASWYERRISRALSDVSGITTEDIRSCGAMNLPTPLRQVPGMKIIHRPSTR